MFHSKTQKIGYGFP